MAFDVRAMENIATAPASGAERFAGRLALVATAAVFLGIVPVGRMALPPVAAFIPAVLGSAVLAEVLTALLFYVQYRIARSSQLALLATAYGASALLTLFYILTFPQVFSPGGLFGATLQTAAWASSLEHILFGSFIIAFSIVGARGITIGRGLVRIGAFVTLALVVAIAFVALTVQQPQLLDESGRTTPFFFSVIEPLQFAVYAAAFALLAFGRPATVTRVWLMVVIVLRVAELLAVSSFSAGRYTAFWYAGRSFVLIASAVMLGVFIVKLNDLLLRLARRNRALTERTEVAELEAAEGEQRYRTLANVVPQLIWTANPRGEIDYVNDRWIAYTGLDVHETRLLGWRGALDEAQPTFLNDAWHESLRSGRPFSGEYRLLEAGTGRLRWFLVNAIAVRDAGGDITRWIGSCTDIDRQKRIEEREAFLARAGDRLSASLDLNATLDTIAGLIVGRMAEWARVDLIDEEGRFVPATVASSLRDEEARLRSLIGTPVTGPLEGLFASALARREPTVFRDRRELTGNIADVRSGSAIVVPLTSGEVALGVLTLVRGDLLVPEADEIVVARDFGRRAAQALDHARLYERERSTADALQRAMLPQVMPQVANVSFSASYSAASESQRVGGDFYDAFTLPDGRVALTIGDVTGHGLEAAVIMGEIRQTLRAASFERAEPAAILDRASKLLVASGRSVFVTAIFGVLDPATGRFEYATAGHPAPLVYDGTTIVRLATAGMPIGLRDDEGVDFLITLPPQCTLVLYTDGLLEFSRDLEEGEQRIEAAICELDADDSDHLAGAIMKRVLREDTASDDIAILTATLGELPQRTPYDTREWRFTSSDARTATHVRHEIGRLVAAWTARPDIQLESEIVFGELFSNVVRHAPGPDSVRAAATGAGAEVIVNDTGSGFPGPGGPSDDFSESGRGLHLVRTLGDDIDIEPSAYGSRVTVHFHSAARRKTGSNAALSSA